MESETCPECGIKIYGRNGNFKCPVHGDYKKDWVTGNLEPQCRCDECDAKSSGYQGA